jgi:hypothetical protein
MCTFADARPHVRRPGWGGVRGAGDVRRIGVSVGTSDICGASGFRLAYPT